jgi:plasmid stability protein
MTPIVVLKMNEASLRKLRQRAARHRRSMNDEVRHILCDAVKDQEWPLTRLAIAELRKGIRRRRTNRPFYKPSR